jgi:AhpC/TSA family
MTLQILGPIVLLIATISCAAMQDTSKIVARTAPVQVGERAPDFALQDQSNRTVALSPQFGKAPVVLVFYRGSW